MRQGVVLSSNVKIPGEVLYLSKSDDGADTDVMYNFLLAFVVLTKFEFFCLCCLNK